MVDYHVGTLDAKAVKLLADGEGAALESTEARDIFLQSKQWTKAIMWLVCPLGSI